MSNALPTPDHFDLEKTGSVWRVDYQQRAVDAKKWAEQHRVTTKVSIEQWPGIGIS